MKLIPTFIPLITRISRVITPISSQGSQRPCLNLPRKATKQPSPPASNTITSGPIGLRQIAATCSGTPGKKRLRNSGIRAPLRASTPVSSSKVLPTTTASSAATSNRNCQPRVSSTGRK